VYMFIQGFNQGYYTIYYGVVNEVIQGCAKENILRY
jgi:hypothetical protein